MFCVKTKNLPYYNIKYFEFETRKEALGFLEKEGYKRDAVGYGLYYENLADFYWNSEKDSVASIFQYQ